LPEDHELYDVPIEELELTESSTQILKNTGIVSIGDCIDVYFFYMSDFSGGQIRSDITQIFYNEIQSRLKELGHIPKSSYE